RTDGFGGRVREGVGLAADEVPGDHDATQIQVSPVRDARPAGADVGAVVDPVPAPNNVVVNGAVAQNRGAVVLQSAALGVRGHVEQGRAFDGIPADERVGYGQVGELVIVDPAAGAIGYQRIGHDHLAEETVPDGQVSNGHGPLRVDFEDAERQVEGP